MVDSSDISYDVNGNIINGRVNRSLNPGEALTIRLELPEGYFSLASNEVDLMVIVSIMLPILFLVIGYIIWRKFGKDNQVIETVEFYPPEGFNSLEVGFLYKGKATNQDVISLIIYLANKGYVKISEFEEKILFSKTKSFKLTKLKEYDGNNSNEQLFFNGLFKNKDVVTASDLYDSFYITMNKILSKTNTKKNKNRIFEKKASNKKIFIILMMLVTYFIITVSPILTYGDISNLIIALIFPGIGFAVMMSMLFNSSQIIYVNGRPSSGTIFVKVFAVVWGFMFGGIPWLIIVLPTLMLDTMYLLVYIIGLVCIIGLFLCLKYLPKRTEYGNKMLGKIRGFKNFLETAEKDRLEAMVMQNPSYFYDILPYTYVLGVSDKWIKKFETISLQSPSWYDGATTFSVVTFGSFMNSAMSSAQSAMSSSPSSSGGSSGGGFSGGGSGGGGGGSW